MSRSVFIKQYGFYRTGTNYLRALLQKNCDCFVCVKHLGWKHGEPIDWNEWIANPDRPVPEGLPDAVRDGLVRTIIIVKDPYAWLHSFLKYWRRANYLKPRPKGGVFPKRVVIDRVDQFNHLYGVWDEFAAKHYGIVMPYEQLLMDFEGQFRRMAIDLNIPLVNDPPKNVKKRVKSGARKVGRSFSPSFFLNRRYLQKLSKQNKDIVTNRVNWHLFRKWGYEPLGRH